MGHSSPAAPLICPGSPPHAADDRDGEIARALDAMLSAGPVISIEPVRTARGQADVSGG